MVSTLALLAVWVVLPFVRRWQDREAAIAAQESQLMQLRTLVQGDPKGRQSLTLRRRAQGAVRQRLLIGSTPALAASSLQALLQAYADTSRVTLDRIDPVAEGGTTGDQDLLPIPVRLSGHADIYGLTELLNHLQHGEKLLVLDEFSVNAGGVAGSKPDLLVFSVRLHGAYSPE